MATSNENVSMALFCDFENVALGVRDAKYEKFDIKPVLERLLLKGSIVVKKAYCDWERYKGFKAAMHEANFELIEIPHVRQSGKNSADIRLVVDALDLCYTKSHVDTFVIISGDSDFSPLVSKLRENAKRVIGVGVKQSTSDLLVANCDEFIFYDDLVRESQRQAAKRDKRDPQPAVKRSSEEETRRRDELEARKVKAIEIAVETFEALVSEQGDGGKIWASVLKDAIKRRKPDFSESYYGFRAFGNLLEEARARGLLDVGRDEKSGTFVFRGHEGAVGNESPVPARRPAAGQEPGDPAVEASQGEKVEPRRKGRGNRRQGNKSGEVPREGSGGRGPRNQDLFAHAETAALPLGGAYEDADASSGSTPHAEVPRTGPVAVPRFEPPVEWRSAAVMAEHAETPGPGVEAGDAWDEESVRAGDKDGNRAAPRRKPRGTRRKASVAESTPLAEAVASTPPVEAVASTSTVTSPVEPVAAGSTAEPASKAAGKRAKTPAARPRRPRKTAAPSDAG